MDNTTLDELIRITGPSRPARDMTIAREIRSLIDHMLGGSMSTIDPTARIWTTEVCNELVQRIEGNPLEGTELTQWKKLDQQLEGASREVVLLAAECVFLREHPLFTARSATRREHIENILENLDTPTEIPAAMNGWLDRPPQSGGFKPGISYNQSMWLQVIWLARFVAYWNGLAETDRQRARTDPWVLQQTMLDSGDDRADIRNALQFLIRPDVFEPISGKTLKTQIQERLSHLLSDPAGKDPESVDKDLLAIRAQLISSHPGEFHFWSPGVEELWKPSSGPDTPTDDEPRSRHYWLFSPGPRAADWGKQSSEGIMAIGWDDLGDLADFADRESIRAALDTDQTGAKYSNDVLAVWEFQNEIRVGDIVYAKCGRRQIVGRGKVTSGPRFEPERGQYTHVRSVDWTHQGEWNLSTDVATKTLTDITKYHDLVEDVEALVIGDEEPAPPEPTDPLPLYDKDAFLREVYLSEARYDRLRSLLLRKKNVILAGPPGVGKTFAAKRLAYSIMEQKDPSRVQMVQFHQSYSYEDFIMGFRPQADGSFALAEGPFYRFCEEARKDDTKRPYFFIIDEINRGNISKIFGELLMLIEADKRGHEIRLLYKNETFSVPANLHIIGMMNTADRSLAVLDYALRRRFGFFEMQPGFDTTGFMAWSEEVDSPIFDTLVGVIKALNEEINTDPALGKGFTIGHSYLSKPIVDDVEGDWLESVVEDELIPLIDEYWFDEPARSSDWAARLREAVG